MLSFVAAAFFLLITPGPGVLSVAGAGAAFGFRAGLPYTAGVVLGTLTVIVAVTTGLAAFLLSYPPLRILLLVASAAYLLYLAYRIATSEVGIAIKEAPHPLGFANGLALQIINPKAYAVMTTLFSGFAFYPDSTVLEAAIKTVIFMSISLPVHLLWLWAGSTVKQLALTPRSARRVNVAMALSMLAVVVLALLS